MESLPLVDGYRKCRTAGSSARAGGDVPTVVTGRAQARLLPGHASFALAGDQDERKSAGGPALQPQLQDGRPPGLHVEPNVSVNGWRCGPS
jgi:hypothetical protein